MERDDRSTADERSLTERSVPVRGGVGSGSSDWERVERTSAFEELARKKRAFIVPAVILFTVFFLGWPALGGFTTLLDGQAIGAMTWAYVYGFAQLATTLVLLHLYTRQAAKWDGLARRAREEAAEGGTGA